MKIFLSIKYHADHSNRKWIEAISAALEANGHACFCVVREIEEWGRKSYPAQDLMRLTFESLRLCAGVVVDLSEKGVGVGIEAGYAHALGKPVWVIARQGAEVSATLRGIAKGVFTYNQPQDLKSILSALKAPEDPERKP